MQIVRNIGVFLIVIGLTLLTIDHVSAYVDSMTKEQRMVLAIKENISKEYKQFLNHINDYKKELPEINPFFVEYYEEILKSDEEYKKIMNVINEKAEEAEESAEKIKHYCSESYIDKESSKQCETFNKNYANFKNSYSELVDKYNRVIEEYNNWAKGTGYKVIAMIN